MTIYLFGFAIGSLFWGKLSDKIGRKPVVILGLSLYVLGCIICYHASSINILLGGRLIQAFGGSIGSVMSQAICRDAFHGPALGKMYALVGSSLAVFPALGPVVGGFIAEYYDWSNVFLFLTIIAVVLIVAITKLLPETHHKDNRKPVQIFTVIKTMFRDKRVIGFGLIVAGCNGITFSYYAEGPFYLMDLLGLSPTQYGMSFILIAFFSMLGGLYSKRLQDSHSSVQIIDIGMRVILISNFIFCALILSYSYKLILNFPFAHNGIILITILAQMITAFGMVIITGNSLATALVDYKWCIGTASSLFGFYYYCIISLFTFGMGYLHNGTLLPMPLYFICIIVFMMIIKRRLIR